jgi:RNA polymerase sigma factor (sigma-70 family)
VNGPPPSHQHAPSDDEVLAGSLVDPGLFAPLVLRHGPRIHSYLSRRSPDADDLLNEVWLAAFEGRRRFDSELGSVIGWLFGIARNVLLTHYRHRGRQGGRYVTDPDTVDEWAAVDARLDAMDEAKGLRAALEALPPEEREVLLLVAWEQLTPSECAQVLGIPAGTARSRLHRARGRLTTTGGERSDDQRQVLSRGRTSSHHLTEEQS